LAVRASTEIARDTIEPQSPPESPPEPQTETGFEPARPDETPALPPDRDIPDRSPEETPLPL
jgi:hypothetical protein